ncbi:DnaA/Hda family protein [Candidatus Pelagibacter sp.]|nr:DnaA/Hda family protein [Candidatus Pelagibacter sp.]|tara:strand:+ start:96 stop:758 length:663 start_codon:yes stop_codon:yes gene_type:complete
MTDLNQLLLNFDLKQNYKYEDYYVGKSNFYAFNLINDWPKWEKNVLNIYGEKYSGKTHLSNIFLKKFKGLKVLSKDFTNETIKEFKVFESIILDDFNQNIDERLMYTLFNIADQDNKFIIINSLKAINEFNFKLDDLISRINNCLFAKIEKPDDELMFAIILKNFSDRQITIEKKFIDYIIKNIDRSYGKIYEFIYKIDEISLKKKKSIDFKIIKEALKV